MSTYGDMMCAQIHQLLPYAFFGVGNETLGHYWYAPNGMTLRRVCRWMERVDGIFPPPGDVQRQGECALHYVHGYTIMAWWDRSKDARPGANALFMVSGRHDFTAMMRVFDNTYPHIKARFPYAMHEVVAP